MFFRVATVSDPRRSECPPFCLLGPYQGVSGSPLWELSLKCRDSADGDPSDCLTKRRTLSLWLTRLRSGRTQTH